MHSVHVSYFKKAPDPCHGNCMPVAVARVLLSAAGAVAVAVPTDLTKLGAVRVTMGSMAPRHAIIGIDNCHPKTEYSSSLTDF